jgi:hypothetical protein
MSMTPLSGRLWATRGARFFNAGSPNLPVRAFRPLVDETTLVAADACGAGASARSFARARDSKRARRRDQNGILAVVARIGAVRRRVSHHRDFALQYRVGDLPERIPTSHSESVQALKTSSRRASKLASSPVESPKWSAIRYSGTNSFRLAPDAGSDPSDQSQHLDVLAIGIGRLMRGFSRGKPGEDRASRRFGERDENIHRKSE